MARPSKHNWEDIRKHYEAGMEQSEIVAKHKCPKSTLSEKIRKEKWQVNELATSVIKGKIEVIEQVNELNKHDVRLPEIIDEIVDKKTRHINLIYGNAEKLANKLLTMADQIDTPNDLKTLSEANDKLAITLKVADRHAPKIDVTQVQGLQEVKRVINVNPTKKIND